MNYIDIIAIIVITLSLLIGLMMGMKKGMRGIYALGTSSLLGVLITRTVMKGFGRFKWYELMNNKYQTPTYMVTLVIVTILLFILIRIVIGLLGELIEDGSVKPVNHITGMVLGGLAGISVILVTVLVINKLNITTPNQFVDAVNHSIVGERINTLMSHL